MPTVRFPSRNRGIELTLQEGAKVREQLDLLHSTAEV